MVRMTSEQWGVVERTFESVHATAVRRIKEKFNQNQPDFLVQKLAQLEHLVQASIDSGSYPLLLVRWACYCGPAVAINRHRTSDERAPPRPCRTPARQLARPFVGEEQLARAYLLEHGLLTPNTGVLADRPIGLPNAAGPPAQIVSNRPWQLSRYDAPNENSQPTSQPTIISSGGKTISPSAP